MIMVVSITQIFQVLHKFKKFNYSEKKLQNYLLLTQPMFN